MHDVNITIFAQFLEGVESRLKEGRRYYISDFKEKLRKVLIDNGLVWQNHRLLWCKRSLDRHFGSQLIKVVDPTKGTFYHLKGTVNGADSLLSVRSVGSRAVDYCLDGEKGALTKEKVMNNEKAKQKKTTNTSSAVNSRTNVELQTFKRVLVSVDFTGETGLHHLKNLLSHQLLPYAPSIF